MYSHLYSSGRGLNIQALQEAAMKELSTILEACEGTKAIVWDDSLAGPVGLISRYSFLKDYGVVKMFALNEGTLPEVDVKNIIYITRPNLKLMDIVAANIHNEERRRRQMKKDFYLYFMPRKSLLCEKQLQNKGVYGSISFVGEFRCEFFPVDKDLISMELKDAYREMYIEGDLSCLHQAALGLVTLQKLYGRIPKIYGKGKHVQTLWELTKTLSIDANFNTSTDKGSIDQLIIIDRSIDLMSVLATQLTYEGLIDELFGIKSTTAYFPADRFTKQEDNSIQNRMSTSDKKSVILNAGEKLYVDIRDKNFNAVGTTLSSYAKKISSQLEERHTEKSVQDMKKFVEKLPEVLAQKSSLAVHTTIAEMIREKTSSAEFMEELECEQDFMLCTDVDKPSPFIEDLIAKKVDFKRVLRLICMQSIAGSGLKPVLLNFYKREVVQVYGIEALLTLGNLERAGLLSVQMRSRSYAVLRKTLKLTVDNFDMKHELFPIDISYVHSFYAPLSIRIIEQILKPAGWQGMRDILTEVSGPSYEDNNLSVSGGNRRGSLTSEVSTLSDTTRVVLVFFLGGCTFAEVAALRFLSQQEENNVEFVVATTKFINKNTFLDSFIEGYN